PEASARNSLAPRPDPLSEMWDGSRPEGDVDVGIEVENPLPLRLRVTAADRDHTVRVGPFQRGGLREMGGEALIGLLADCARVEDDDVRRLGRRGFPEAQFFEHALDPLGVVGVHLAPKGGDVVALHAFTVAPSAASTWRIRWPATP